MGVTQKIPQEEGREARRPPHAPCPVHWDSTGPLSRTQARLGNTEKVMAFLDDIIVATPEPDRVTPLWLKNCGPTPRSRATSAKGQVWNRGGIEPAGMEDPSSAARLEKPDAVVWKGDPHLPPHQQGLRVLGVTQQVSLSLLRRFFVRENPRTGHPISTGPHGSTTLRPPTSPHVAATRAKFLLRAVRPDLTEEFAIRHDRDVWRFLCTILGTFSAPEEAQVLASLSFSNGGLRLAGAHRVRTASPFSPNWADSIKMVRKRHPHIAATMIRNLEVGDQSKFPSRARLQRFCGCWT